MERRDPAGRQLFREQGGRGERTTAPITLQDLQRRIYTKAKADPSWRFWGLYVHICKRETLHAAYALSKANDGAPGSDGVTFEAIEATGVDGFLEQLRDELATLRYRPMRPRRQEIPKDRLMAVPIRFASKGQAVEVGAPVPRFATRVGGRAGP